MPRKKLSADERRAVTVQAVIELAAIMNPAEITTAAIAEQMGLTQGALFRHFENKEAVLEEVMLWVKNSLLERVDAASHQKSAPLGALKATYMAHIQFVCEHPGVPRLIFSELQRTGDTAAKRVVQMLLIGYGRHLYQLFDAAKAQGEISETLEIMTAIPLFIGSIQGLVLQSLVAGDTTQIQQQAEKMFEIYCNGIRR